MRVSSALTGLFVLPVLTACSIHPLQQDVTEKKTIQIVDHIRCETRLAIETKVITLLQEYGNQLRQQGDEQGAQKAEVLAKRLEENREIFGRKDIRHILDNETEKNFYDKYINAAIALDFTFQISEENKQDTQIDLIKPLTRGMFSLALSDTGDLKRMNTRRFIISNSFGELLDNNIFRCDNFSMSINPEYPISGSIGMRELIDTFVDINREAPLQIVDKVDNRVFADTLLFTTTMSASITPKIGMPTLGRNLQIMDASITALGSRMDGHQVLIGLSFPPKPSAVSPPRPKLSFLLRPREASRAQKSSANSAKDRAIQATIDQRYNTFLDSFSGLGLR